MLTTVNTLKGYTLDSLDGEMGKVEEFYFDDRYWAIRYLIANTGSWLSGRQVLISPYALGTSSAVERDLTVTLPRAQIEDGPALDSAVPVSRQYEEEYYGHYGWPLYWGGSAMWGASGAILRDHGQQRDATGELQPWDAHLRSTRDVTGHHIQAPDGEIGHVEDFIVDDETWAIRYLVVNTENWWPGRKVLIAPQWIDRVSWAEGKVFVGLMREHIRNSPEFKSKELLTRDYELGLHRHYSRDGYWLDEPAASGRSR